jgi:hypothetical protein
VRQNHLCVPAVSPPPCAFLFHAFFTLSHLFMAFLYSHEHVDVSRRICKCEGNPAAPQPGGVLRDRPSSTTRLPTHSLLRSVGRIATTMSHQMIWTTRSLSHPKSNPKDILSRELAGEKRKRGLRRRRTGRYLDCKFVTGFCPHPLLCPGPIRTQVRPLGALERRVSRYIMSCMNVLTRHSPPGWKQAFGVDRAQFRRNRKQEPADEMKEIESYEISPSSPPLKTPTHSKVGCDTSADSFAMCSQRHAEAGGRART